MSTTYTIFIHNEKYQTFSQANVGKAFECKRGAVKLYGEHNVRVVVTTG